MDKGDGEKRSVSFSEKVEEEPAPKRKITDTAKAKAPPTKRVKSAA